MAQVVVLKARARQLAAEDDFTLLFSFGSCDWYAVADLLSNTLTPLYAGNHEAQVHTSMDWSPVLRMMLRARSQDRQPAQQWLSLSVCTVCAGLAVGPASNSSANMDGDLVRQVLMEALQCNAMHRGNKQSACALKLASAACLQTTKTVGNYATSDQAAISPQILAVHVLDKALQSPLSTGFGTGGLWKQLVSTWSTARGKRLSHCQESEELQLCADIAGVLCKASMCSNHQDAVYDALQQAPPGEASAAASLLIVESLPEPALVVQRPEVQTAACSILGLLVNVTHQSPQLSQLCASHEPLFHLAQTLLCSLRLLAKPREGPASDRSCADLTAFVSSLLCLLINVVEHSTEAGVTLAQMDIPATATAATPSPQCQKDSENACWDNLANHSKLSGNFYASGGESTNRDKKLELLDSQHLCASMDIQNAMLDDFHVKEDVIISQSSPQTCGMHSARHRQYHSSRQRLSASSSGQSNPRSRKRHSSTMLQSSCRTSASTDSEVRKGSLHWVQLPLLLPSVCLHLQYFIMRKDRRKEAEISLKAAGKRFKGTMWRIPGLIQTLHLLTLGLTDCGLQLQGNRASVKPEAAAPANGRNATYGQVSSSFLDYLCHRIVGGDNCALVCGVDAARDAGKKDVATDIRSLMGLLAGFLLMVLPPQACQQVDKLLVGEVQCIVRETLASGTDDNAQSTNRLLKWARSKHR